LKNIALHKNITSHKNSIQHCNSHEMEKTWREMTEIFISSRLLSLTYKSCEHPRGIPKIPSLSLAKIDWVKERVSTKRAILSGNTLAISNTYFRHSPILHMSAVRFLDMSHERNIFRHLFSSIISWIFKIRRGEISMNANSQELPNCNRRREYEI